MDKRDLEHWLREEYPVVLVRYDISEATGYWVYVQRYFQWLREFSLDHVLGGTQIHIPRRNVLTVAAMKRFAEYKRGVILRQAQKRAFHG